MSYIVVPDIVITIFAYLHIISAMGWLGGAILFTSAVGPGLRGMSPAAGLEFFAMAVPRLSWYFLLVATSTVIFGPFLLLTISDYSPSVYFGMATGLTAYLVMLTDFRLFGRISRMAKEIMKSGQSGPPPAEYLKTLRVGRISTLATVLLLVATLMFMVYSGFPF